MKGEILFKINENFESKLNKSNNLVFEYIKNNYKDCILITVEELEKIYNSIFIKYSFNSLLAVISCLKRKGFLIEQYRKFEKINTIHKEIIGGTTNKNYQYIINIKKLYNIEYDDYLLIKEQQNNKCAICNNFSINKELSIDHCHKTGKIRGLLCNNCNLAIGLFKDDIILLKQAIKYLTFNENK